MEETATLKKQSLREMLDEAGLRLARWEETRAQRFVFECAACHDLMEFQPWSVAPNQCYQCGTNWEQASMRFHVLVPKDEPRPHPPADLKPLDFFELGGG